MLFLVIFVLIAICFYTNCDFLLFCGKALIIFVRFAFCILQVALCSGVVSCLASYLLSSIVHSMFFPIVFIVSVILLVVWFWFLTIILFLLIICLISSYVIMVFWEVGPDHLEFQHCIKDHRPPENSWLQWILIGESLWRSPSKIKDQFHPESYTIQSWCLTPLKKEDRNTSQITLRWAV